MAWIQPKTDWKGGPAASGGNVPSADDFNRIEGNIDALGNLRGFPTAGGTGTAIILTTGVFELVDGRAITFIANAANGKAATTINIDNTGALPLYRPGTTSAPNIIAGKAYTVWYSAASGCFFLKASAEGDAQAGDVLAGKKFSNDDDTGIAGTLTLTGTATDADVLAGKTYYNTNAKTKRTGNIPNLAGDSVAIASSVSGTTLKLRPPRGYKDGVDDTVSITDANFIAANIKKDVHLLGLIGTLPFIDALAPGTTYKVPINVIRGYYSSPTKLGQVSVRYISGTVRVTYVIQTSPKACRYGGVYINGVRRTWHAYKGDDVTIAEDITVNADDTIEIWGCSDGGYAIYISDAYVEFNSPQPIIG
jgi:hypothetical protein